MLRLDIKTVIDQKGLTLRQVADKADVAYNTILNMYRGVTTRVDLEVLERVTTALEVEPSDVLVKRELQAA